MPGALTTLSISNGGSTFKNWRVWDEAGDGTGPFSFVSVSGASAAGGLVTTVARLLSAAATTNGTSIKASAGSLFAVTLQNVSASPRYLKFYNKASAPTVGTDTPVLTFYIPASGMFTLDRPAGIYFATGIAYAITGAAADADTTAITAGDIVCLNVEYA